MNDFKSRDTASNIYAKYKEFGMKKIVYVLLAVAACIVFYQGKVYAEEFVTNATFGMQTQNSKDTFIRPVVLSNSEVYAVIQAGLYQESNGRLYVFWKDRKYYVQKSNDPKYDYMIYDNETSLWYYFH